MELYFIYGVICGVAITLIAGLLLDIVITIKSKRK